jgi:hypothetical protein
MGASHIQRFEAALPIIAKWKLKEKNIASLIKVVLLKADGLISGLRIVLKLKIPQEFTK